MTFQAPLHHIATDAPKHPPLLLVHGFAGHGDSWEVVAPLLDDRDVWILTLPGHDPACSVPEGESFDEIVGGIGDFLRGELALPVDVLGYSLGARVALGVLVRRPGLFRTAYLVGINPGIENEKARKERARWDGEWANSLEDSGIEDFVRRWEELPLFMGQTRLPGKVLARQREIRLRHDPKSLAAALRALGLSAMPDYRPEIPKLAVPVHVIAGSEDEKFTRIALDIVTRVSEGTLTPAPGAGHNVPLESPEWLVDFIRRMERENPL